MVRGAKTSWDSNSESRQYDFISATFRQKSNKAHTENIFIAEKNNRNVFSLILSGYILSFSE